MTKISYNILPIKYGVLAFPCSEFTIFICGYFLCDSIKQLDITMELDPKSIPYILFINRTKEKKFKKTNNKFDTCLEQFFSSLLFKMLIFSIIS